jgi:tetratricopeptide (TPR) repeat protein
MITFLLAFALVVGVGEEMLPYQGIGFTLQYPKKHSKLQPPSANVPFQLEYRKNSLFRLETERLVQPIDLEDEAFASIFLEVQLERLRERVSVPLEQRRALRFAWGTGIEFTYFLPARSGKKNRRDLVTEVVTTKGEMLYRFTYWIPERDMKKAAAPLRAVLESFRLDAPAETDAGGESAARAARLGFPFSLLGALNAIQAYRQQLEEENRTEGELAEIQASLAEALGWKAYLEGEASPAELEEMERAAEAAVRLAPQDVDSQHARAYAAYHSNRMVEMETAIKEAVRLDPQNAESYLLYAIWYGFNPARAEELAEEALQHEPDLVAAHYVRALAAQRIGNLAEARESLESAVSIDPSFSRAHQKLAEILDESGDKPGALRAYRAAAAAAPEDLETRFRLAVALRKSGRVDEAVSEYGKLVVLDPDLSEVHYNLAVLYVQEKQQPDLAAEHFKRFLELEPESDKADRVRDWLSSRGYIR